MIVVMTHQNMTQLSSDEAITLYQLYVQQSAMGSVHSSNETLIPVILCIIDTTCSTLRVTRVLQI